MATTDDPTITVHPQNLTPASHDTGAVVALLWAHKIFILLTITVFAAISAVVAFMMPKWYEATVNIVPPNNQNSALGGLLGNVSSALKDIGLSKLSGGSSNSGYSYMVILTSRSFQDSLIHRFGLAQEYEIPDSMHETVRAEFLNNFTINFTPEGNYMLTAASKDPLKAAQMANASVEIANNIAGRLQREEASTNRRYMEMRLRATDSSLATIGDSLKKFSRDNLVFSPMDQAKAMATSLAELKASAIKQGIQTDILRQTLGENDPETQRQKHIQEELETQIVKAENEPGFAGNFAMKDAMSIGVKYLKFYTEFEALSKVKGFLMPMLEQARLDEIRKSQTMYIVDEAIPASKKARPKRGMIIAGAALGGLVLASLFVIIRRWLRELRAATGI